MLMHLVVARIKLIVQIICAHLLKLENVILIIVTASRGVRRSTKDKSLHLAIIATVNLRVVGLTVIVQIICVILLNLPSALIIIVTALNIERRTRQENQQHFCIL
ncbi:hypothetical protein P8452_63594 [Trifolium repens]|nr:hypothetical protein P8452_63594 [Trifolium repens]